MIKLNLAEIMDRVEKAKSCGHGVGKLALDDVPKLVGEIEYRRDKQAKLLEYNRMYLEDNKRLVEENWKLREENSRLCPIGDLDTITTLRTEIAFRDDEIERLRKKQAKKEITETAPGGGKCPSCGVRLIGKSNYCGKCGQRIGWEVYGGNIYDKRGDDE